MTRKTFSAGALMLAGLFALAACDSTGPDQPSGLTILLTDAPGDVAEAWVRVDGIYLQGDGGQTWLLEEQTEWIDLLTLAGTNTATLVEDAVVPPGLYHQMRFIVREAVVVANDGGVYATPWTGDLPAGVDSPTGTLQCASCETPAGLRVGLPGGGVEIGTDAQILVVDFDVYESLENPGLAGASNTWVMTPMLWATDFTASATLSGTVTLADEVEFPESCGEGEPGFTHFIPRLEEGGEYVANGSTDEEGNWVIGFAHPGSYTLTHVSEVVFEGGTLAIAATASPSEVTLEAGQGSTAAFVIDALACEEAEGEEDDE